jgi:arylsulfatase A-like enzyme
MQRREFLAALGATALVGELAAAEKAPRKTQARPDKPAHAEHAPDVLVILADQWNPRYLSWDDPQVRTPNLDRLAGEGMIFDACYTPSPICVPARISLITGLYPHNQGHAVWGNPNEYHVTPAAAPMFRDIQQAGYSTAQIGKLHWFTGADWKKDFASLDDYHRAMGLDYVMNVSGPVDSPADHNPYAQYLRERGLLDTVAADLHKRYLNWEYEPRASVVKPEDYHDSFVTGDAVDYIGRHPKDKPMCLVVSLHAPHPPLDAPGEFATMFDPEKLTLPPNVPEGFQRAEGRTFDHAGVRQMLANYLGKMALVDHCIGRLVSAMRARGTWESALVVFSADHGEMMGAHGLLSKGRFWEESGRVPLVVRWPGQVHRGRTRALAQMCDIYPTIVEAIGGELSPGRFARSLLPVATGKRTAVRELAISEIGKRSPLGMMVHNGRYKWWADGNKEYLFDLEKDPWELANLAEAPEHRETLSQMRHNMLNELRSTQVNLAEGSKSKVQRLREAEAKQHAGDE